MTRGLMRSRIVFLQAFLWATIVSGAALAAEPLHPAAQEPPGFQVKAPLGFGIRIVGPLNPLNGNPLRGLHAVSLTHQRGGNESRSLTLSAGVDSSGLTTGVTATRAKGGVATTIDIGASREGVQGEGGGTESAFTPAFVTETEDGMTRAVDAALIQTTPQGGGAAHAFEIEDSVAGAKAGNGTDRFHVQLEPGWKITGGFAARGPRPTSPPISSARGPGLVALRLTRRPTTDRGRVRPTWP